MEKAGSGKGKGKGKGKGGGGKKRGRVGGPTSRSHKKTRAGRSATSDRKAHRARGLMELLEDAPDEARKAWLGAQAKPSAHSPRRFCDLSGNEAPYTDPSTKVKAKGRLGSRSAQKAKALGASLGTARMCDSSLGGPPVARLCLWPLTDARGRNSTSRRCATLGGASTGSSRRCQRWRCRRGPCETCEHRRSDLQRQRCPLSC